MKLHAFLIATLASVTLSTQAATYNWGPHASLEYHAGGAENGPLSDQFVFTLTSSTDITSTTVSNNLSTVLNLEDGMVSLYRQSGAADMLIGSYSFDGSTGSTWHSYLSLAPGGYYYLVTGNASGSAGARYQLSSHVAVPAVPEPQTVALMLAGLGLLVLRQRRP